MTSLRDMHERMTQWMNEKPTFDGGNELRLAKNDLVIFNFASSGEDGDQLVKVYRSHILEATSPKTGKKYNTHRYCPTQSGEDVACPLCEAGVKGVKERMSIWMYVHVIYHAQLPQDKQFPLVEYEGARYYQEDVAGWRIWHTSAWRDSCWGDIVKLYNVYKGLHNFSAQLICSGEGLSRRYKVFALPNSPMFSEEMYARAKEECEAIPDILHRQMNTPVQQNPGDGQESPVGQPVPTSNPFGGQQIGQPQPVAREDGPRQVDPPPSAPEADSRRPLKSLF